MLRRTWILGTVALSMVGPIAHAQLQPNPADAAPQPETINTIAVRKDVYFLQGRSDAAFVVGDDGVILIDTMTAGHADLIKQRIAEVTNKPIKYVVNTHFHQDHTGSNEPFGLAGIPIVAQENTLKRLSAPSTNMRGVVAPPAPMAARPNLTFKDKKTLSVGGVKAQLIYAPAGHTDGDTYVWLAKQNVIVAGDLLHTHEYPFFDVKDGGTLEGNIRSLEVMLKLADQNTVILPGHGGPFTKAQLKTYLDMMYRTRDAVRQLIKQGKSEDEVVAMKLLQDDRSVLSGGPDNRDNFVRVVYQAEKPKTAELSSAMPTQMQAIVETGSGGPEVLQLKTLPVRSPEAGQVLIRVYAAAVNPADWKMRSGMGGPAGSSGGRIPGFDVAGVVEKVGDGVIDVKVGQPVLSMLTMSIPGLNGGYAQFALAPAEYVQPKPKSLTYAQAAGLGTVGMTAQRSIEQANIKPGQRLFITGVAGGVGSTAAQIAKARGVYVIGTASARHNAFLKSIGVDEIIDYTQGSFVDKVKNVDVVIDTVGGDTARLALSTLKKGGTFLTVAVRDFTAECTAAGMVCPVVAGPGLSTSAQLKTVTALADTGKLSIRIDKVYPLARAGEAQEFNREGHTEGKVILAVDEQKVDTK